MAKKSPLGKIKNATLGTLKAPASVAAKAVDQAGKVASAGAEAVASRLPGQKSKTAPKAATPPPPAERADESRKTQGDPLRTPTEDAPATKTAVQKAPTVKAPAKKAAPKKTVAAKTVTKKAPARKPAAKTAPKKTVAAKTVTKKAPAKKPAAKTAPKKTRPSP